MKDQEQKINYETKALPEIFRELEEAKYSQATLREKRKKSTYFYEKK